MQTLVFFNKKAKRSSTCGCCSQTPYSSQTLYSYSTVTMNTGCYCFRQTQEDQVCGIFLKHQQVAHFNPLLKCITSLLLETSLKLNHLKQVISLAFIKNSITFF